MSQNTSHAVMAQRAEPNDSLDDFPTPPYAWIVWLSGGAPSCTMLEWIPPCRAKLERDGDYQCDSTAASIALKSPPAISDRATEPGGAQP